MEQIELWVEKYFNGWGMPAVSKHYLKLDLRSVCAKREWADNSCILNENPWPFSQFKLTDGSVGSERSRIGGLFVGIVNLDRIASIDAENGKTNKFKNYRRVVYPMFFLVKGTLALTYGWWHLRFCRCGMDLLIGGIKRHIGLLVNIWGWLVLTARRGI